MLNCHKTLKYYSSIICMGIFFLTNNACAMPISIELQSLILNDKTGQEIKYQVKHNKLYKNNSLRNEKLYNQNAGVDPTGWLLSGPALDAAASAMARPYYESYGYHSVPRNYIYYDWGW
ncbi:MAG: hypothetical protein ACR2HL_08780 [Methylocystis sp.]